MALRFPNVYGLIPGSSPVGKTLVAAAIVAVLCTGCPSAGTPGSGAWVVYLDVGCDNIDPLAYMVVLYPDQQAEFYEVEVYGGTWNVVNGVLAITLPDTNGSQYLFTANLGNGVLTGGAWTADDVFQGCVTGRRISP